MSDDDPPTSSSVEVEKHVIILECILEMVSLSAERTGASDQAEDYLLKIFFTLCGGSSDNTLVF